MSLIDPVFAAVTAPGTPFEIGERDGIRRFVNAPSDLAILIDAARRHGEKTFLVEGERRLSFEATFRLRDALVALLNINRGERVAICMRNRIEWMVGFMATLRLGGVAALINSRGSPAELAAAVNDVSPAVVLADMERAQLLRAGGYEGRIIKAEDFPTSGPPLPAFTPAQADDPCAILFTSGTTGRTKGAVLSHRNLVTGILAMQLSGVMMMHNTAKQYGVPVETIVANMPQQAVLLVYPLFHISGLGAAFLSYLFSGNKVVIMRRWDVQDALHLIEKESITQLTAVPTMLWDMLHKAKLAEANLSSLRSIGTGGQAIQVNLVDEIRAVCPQAIMGTGYGMTETAGSISMAQGEDFIRKRTSGGRVLNLVEVRTEAPDGRVLKRGQTGEIVVRGAIVMKGYWNRPEDTAAVLTPDGWLHTGDIGYVDEEGYVFIVDRKKDMVISGGENIYCAEVERVIGSMPQVTECATFGIPDERLGELLVAVVVADHLDEAAIVNEVSDKLARYKSPGQVAFSHEPLPRNAIGKIDKNKLRALWPSLKADA